MREHLLGYLLGVLDAAEQAEVERAIRRHPGLRQELDNLRLKLDLLETRRGGHEPPGGLARRTCSRIDDEICTPPPNDDRPVRNQHKSALSSSRPPASRPPAPSPGAASGLPASGLSASGLSASGEQYGGGRSRGWSLSDMVVGAGVFLAASLLFFPIIASSRMSARIAACQNNLRILGTQHVIFSGFDEHGRFPYIPSEGKEAYAGFYATQLVESQLLPDSTKLICPASQRMDHAERFVVPSRELLNRAEGVWLRRWRHIGGGSYTYGLGLVLNGIHQAPRNRGRAFFALMSDAPSEPRSMGRGPTLSHGGRGYNFLFEDGHVVFVKGCLDENCPDNPLINDHGYVEAGRSANDAVLAPSPTPPFITLAYWRH